MIWLIFTTSHIDEKLEQHLPLKGIMSSAIHLYTQKEKKTEQKINAYTDLKSIYVWNTATVKFNSWQLLQFCHGMHA